MQPGIYEYDNPGAFVIFFLIKSVTKSMRRVMAAMLSVQYRKKRKRKVDYKTICIVTI